MESGLLDADHAMTLTERPKDGRGVGEEVGYRNELTFKTD